MKAGLNNGVATYLTDRPATHITVQPGYRVSAGDHFSYHCTEVRVEAKLRLPHTRNSSKLSTALIDMTQASTDKRKQSLPDSRLLTEAKAGGKIDLVIIDTVPAFPTATPWFAVGVVHEYELEGKKAAALDE